MAVRRVWLGSTGPFLFDDSVLYNDVDGVITPDNQQAIATDGQILVQTAPYSDFHVVRKVELDNLEVILGLGTMAYQNANAVAITGGVATVSNLSVTSLADIALARVGWPTQAGYDLSTNRLYAAGLSHFNSAVSFGNAPTTRSNLGLGTMATQNAGAVAITGGNAAMFSLVLGPTGTLPPATQGMIWFPKNSTYGLTFAPTDNDTGPATPLRFWNASGTSIGSISTNASSTSFNTTSDTRLKNSVTPLTGAIDVLRSLNPVSFLWNADGSQGHGFLAHELQQEIPEAVTGEKDAVNEDGSVLPQQVDHSKLVVWLVSAVQELAARVVSLEQQLAT